MSKKKIIIVIIIIILIIIAGLWIRGIIPKQIAKIYATNYMKNNFPKMQLEYVSIEWSQYHNGYIINFKDNDNNTHSCTISSKYFPVNIGQGLLEIEETYRERFEGEKDNSSTNTEYSFFGKIVESNRTYIIVEPNEDEEERKSSDKISIGLGENNDAIYMVGTNVKITYDGNIMESYPAQVNQKQKNIIILYLRMMEVQILKSMVKNIL